MTPEAFRALCRPRLGEAGAVVAVAGGLPPALRQRPCRKNRWRRRTEKSLTLPSPQGQAGVGYAGKGGRNWKSWYGRMPRGMTPAAQWRRGRRDDCLLLFVGSETDRVCLTLTQAELVDMMARWAALLAPQEDARA